MTAPRLTKRRTSLEKHQDEVIAFLLNGWNWARIAEKYSVSRQAVMMFQRRHADKLQALQAVVTKQVEDYAIAQKVNRVATNDMLKNLLLQVRDARARGEMGMETGLVVRREKALGSGDGMVIVEEYEIDPAVVMLIDRLHHATANELGQLPKAATVDLSDRRTYILEVVTNGNGVPLG